MIPGVPLRVIKQGTGEIIKEVHVTELEQLMKCPYKAIDFGETTMNGHEAFYEGDITEQLMTSYWYGEHLGNSVLQYYHKSREFPKLARLNKHVANFLSYCKRHPIWKERYPLFTQKRMTLQILNGKYLIKLSGTADWVFDNLHIADCKTSKNKWREKDLEWKLQWRVYPWMLKMVSNYPILQERDWFKFTYFIWTKHVTPQFQVITKEGKYDETQVLVEQLVTEYCQYLDQGEFPRKKNIHCNMCSHKTNCPLWNVMKDERF